MEQPLIYKYQPLLIKDFEFREDFVSFIRGLISMDCLNLIFVGDNCSGKTSIIWGIVREYYNCKNKFVTNENILTINSLKDQGLSYYRTEVKTFCQTSCSISGKKKFVILDDIDMINEQSQQVFRNCIDNYSNKVHFIASCVNPHKVIQSLQSRLTILKLYPLRTETLIKIAKRICNEEKITMTKEAQEFIVDISNNSVRVLINYLEKLKLLSMNVNVEVASNICTNISFQKFSQYTDFCKKNNVVEAIKILYDIFDQGYSVMDILDNYFLFVKTTSVLKESEKYTAITIICKYIAMFHNIHEDEIELSFFTNTLISALHH